MASIITSRLRRTAISFSAEIDLHLEREREKEKVGCFDLLCIYSCCHVGVPLLCLFLVVSCVGRNLTQGRRQLKTLLPIDERGPNIARNTVFDCNLSPVRRQMAFENSVSSYCDLRSSIVLTFSIAAYPVRIYDCVLSWTYSLV